MATARKNTNPRWLVLVPIISIILISLIIMGYYFVKMDHVTQPQIAVIPVYGEIALSESSLADGAHEIASQIEKADKNPEINAIILEINSPGGGVVASEEISKAVDNAKKPVVAWLREVAASGAYWIASSTDKIVADPATITGSIGVTASYLEFSGLMEKMGVGYERLVTGEYKDLGTPYRKATENEKLMFQQKIQTINEMFIKKVSTGRNMSEDKVREIATGEIFLGTQAKDLGLVDFLGGKAEAQAVAEQLAGVQNAKLVTFKKKVTLMQLLTASAKESFYSIGLGIGDSWKAMAEDQDVALKAQLG